MSTLDRASIEAQIIKKALKESAFRQNLITDPKAAIEKAFNVVLPAGVNIKVHQDTADTYNLVLPLTDTGSEEFSGAGSGSTDDCSGWSSAAECSFECTQCGNNDTTCAPGPTEE